VSIDYDVAIAGLGAMGSATASQLARRGASVVGFDRFTPPHDQGSSHGQTRIIREAYFEHPHYVPLVRRAYELWRQLEAHSHTTLLRETGGLMIGKNNSVVVAGALQSAREHGLSHELLTGAEVRRRFPALRPDDDMVAVWEPRAGILFPERCIAAHLAQAHQHGATLHFDEPVLRWSADLDGEGARVVTERREVRARQLLVSAGAWAASLLPDAAMALKVERQVQFWFEPGKDPAHFEAEHCPVHLWQVDGRRFFYGIPNVGSGVKVAFHHDGEETTPERARRDVMPAELEEMRGLLRRFMPAADGVLKSTAVCLYTNTRDEHFWIDRHPAWPQVLIASPCSGHGFKFTAVLGEVLADLLEKKSPAFDLSLFRTR
jgi:sarcosine oxidase